MTILQQELDISHREVSKRSDELEKRFDEFRKLEESQEKAMNKINSLKIQIDKLTDENTVAKLRLKVWAKHNI